MGICFSRAGLIGLVFLFPSVVFSQPVPKNAPLAAIPAVSSPRSWEVAVTAIPAMSRRVLSLRCATPVFFAKASLEKREAKSPENVLKKAWRKVFSSLEPNHLFLPEARASWDPALWLNRADVNAGVLQRVTERLQAVERVLEYLHLDPGVQGYLVSDPPSIFLLKETYNTLAFVKSVLENPNHAFQITYDAAAFANLTPASPNEPDTIGLFDREHPTRINIREEWRDPRNPNRTLDLETYSQVCSAPSAPAACRVRSREELIGLYAKNIVHEMAHRRLHEINYADEPVPTPSYASAATRESFTAEMFSYGIEALFSFLKPDLSEAVASNDMERALLPFFNTLRTQLRVYARGESDVATERHRLVSRFLEDFNPSYLWYRPGTDPFSTLHMLTVSFDRKGMLLETPILGERGVQVYTPKGTLWQHPGAFEAVSDTCGDIGGDFRCARVATHCYGPLEGSRCEDRTSFGLGTLYKYEGPPPDSNPAQRKMYFAVNPSRLGLSARTEGESAGVLPYPYHLGAVEPGTAEPLLPTDVAEKVRREREERPPPAGSQPPLSPAERESCRPPEGQSGTCTEPVRDRGGCNYSQYRTEYDENGDVVGFYRTDCFPSESDGRCVCSSPAFYGAPDYETKTTGYSETRIEVEGGGDLCRNANGGFSPCGAEP